MERWHTTDPAPLGVVVHVYYPSLLPEILSGLARLPEPFDLLITNASGEALTPRLGGMSRLRRSAILNVGNRGRDMLPLVLLVRAGLLDPYDIVLKLHTKKSPWRASAAHLPGDGDVWRRAILAGLLGSEDEIRQTLHRFDDDRGLGLVAAPGDVLGSDFWGDNVEATAALAQRAGMRFARRDLRFVSGSMYWSRGDLLRSVGDLGLSLIEFEDERGQVDGTTAHALERWIGLRAAAMGLSIHELDEAG